MRRDGTVLVGLIALLVVGAVVLAPGLGGNGPDFQPAGRGPYGLSGLAAGLQASGVAVSVRNRPTLAGRLSVIVEPQYVSHDEAAAWLASARAGATIVYATDHADPFTRTLGVRFIQGGAVHDTASGRAAFPGASVTPRTSTAMLLPGSARSLYAAGAGSAAAVIPVGRGSVWVLSEPVWLVNGLVTRSGLPILLPIAFASGRAASFNVYPQSGAGGLDVLPYLPSWVTLLVVEAAAAAGLLLAAVSRRAGPVYPESTEPAAELGDLVPSLAELYEESGQLAVVVRPLAAAVARRRGPGARRVAGPLERLRDAADVRTAVQAWQDATADGR